MTDLPTIRPEDVSPDSPFFLSARSLYVVGYPVPVNKVAVVSNHVSGRNAQLDCTAENRRRGSDPKRQVYRVVRNEGG